jgi:hypothetical protein
VTAQQVTPTTVEQPNPAATPAPGARLFSDKRLMDNPEGDRRILRRARELADQRNSPDGAA